MHIHDAQTHKLGYFVIEEFAHPSDLSVESLGEYDFKDISPDNTDFARLGHGVQYGNPAGHFFAKTFTDALVNSDQVFLFMGVFRPQDFVDDITVTGEQYQSFRRFIQATNGKDTLVVIDSVYDIPLHAPLCGAGNSYRFIIGNIDAVRFARGATHYLLPINRNHVTRLNFGAELGARTINFYAITGDKFIGFTARAMTRFADKLVKPDTVVGVH